MLVPIILAGCNVNSAKRLPTGGTPRYGHAVVIYGLGVEGNWGAPKFGQELDQYDLKKQVAIGNCFHFTRTEVSIPAVPGPIKYFAFDVPAGYYVYSPFNTGTNNVENEAFYAPEDRTVYVGNFVYSKLGEVELRRSTEAMEGKLAVALPDVKGPVTLATMVAVKRPIPFLCTP